MCQEFCPWGEVYTPRADRQTPLGRHPQNRHPPGRHPPDRHTHPPGRHIHPLPGKHIDTYIPTPPGRHIHPPGRHHHPTHQMATAADSTHPTGMHSCFNVRTYLCNGAFTLPETETDTDRDKFTQNVMGICIYVCLFTSTQFYTTHFLSSWCRAIWTQDLRGYHGEKYVKSNVLFRILIQLVISSVTVVLFLFQLEMSWW